MIWLISDPHFGHHNIVHKFEPPRPFKSVEHMNETMINNWNDRVKPGDKVYVLGDVFFGPKEDFQKLWPRLRGRKRLILGNHDDARYLSQGGFFQKVMLWRWLGPFLLTHVPVHPSVLGESRGGFSPSVNIHGHTHFNGSPEGRYQSVCVEMIDYSPVSLDSLMKKWRVVEG